MGKVVDVVDSNDVAQSFVDDDVCGGEMREIKIKLGYRVLSIGGSISNFDSDKGPRIDLPDGFRRIPHFLL